MRKNTFKSAPEVKQQVYEVHDKLWHNAQRRLGVEALKEATYEEANQHIIDASHDASDTFVRHNKERHEDFPIVELTKVVSDTIQVLPELKKGSSDAKDQMIAFNGALKTIIREQTSIPPEQLLYMVRGVAESLGHEHNEAREIVQRTRETIQGVKHELAVEGVLMNLPEEYSYRESTPKEDRAGADFIVTAPNGVEVFIDVKASEKTANQAWNKQAEYHYQLGRPIPKTQLIKASGFDDRYDFIPGSWNADYEATKELTPDWKHAIDDAASYIDFRARASSRNKHDKIMA